MIPLLLFPVFIGLLFHHLFNEIVKAEKHVQHFSGELLGFGKRNGRNPRTVTVNVSEIAPQKPIVFMSQKVRIFKVQKLREPAGWCA